MSFQRGIDHQAAAAVELADAIDARAFHRLTPEPVVLPRYDDSTEVVERVLEGLRAL
ncbi:hypothetical protein [Streptomyces sp. ISL-87]|uniref:hypothetical protein n=1 Tax=Streptomyces sp. ISL-87 TaxID=2819188 RepID=UPI001BEB1629|nr:hypothetical protein [Streptomyces sp. ISL-87]